MTTRKQLPALPPSRPRNKPAVTVVAMIDPTEAFVANLKAKLSDHIVQGQRTGDEFGWLAPRMALLKELIAEFDHK